MAEFFFQLDKKQRLLQVKDPSLSRSDQADDSNSVLFPITEQLSVADPKQYVHLANGWDWHHQQHNVVFDNTTNGAKKSDDFVRVVNLRRKIGTPDNWVYADDDPLQIEVPLVYLHVDYKTDSQSYAVRLIHTRDDTNGEITMISPEQYQALKDANKEFFRVVRYTADNMPDGEPWIDVALRTIVAVSDRKQDIAGYEGQRRLYRIQYGYLGDPIDDPDDPYRPTFAKVDYDLDWAPEVKSDTINPPYRSTFLEGIVNFGFGGAIECQKPGHPVGGGEQKPPVSPSINMATIVQDDTQVADATRFLFSGFFQFPHGQGLPSSDGEWMLLEFGGNDNTTTPFPGNPSNSSIGVVRESDPTSGDEVFRVRASFVGGSKKINYDLGLTYWGFRAADVDQLGGKPYGPNAGDPENLTLIRGFGGAITIGNEEKMQEFLENWHHLAVQWNLEESLDWNDNPIIIKYVWIPETAITFLESDGSVGTGPLYNAPIIDAVNIFTGGTQDMDPTNVVIHSPTYDIRGNTVNPVKIGYLDMRALPDPNTMPRQRIYTLSQGLDSPFSHYSAAGLGIYWGISLTSWPYVVVDSNDDPSIKRYIPFKMTLDRNKKMDTEDSGSDSQSLIGMVALSSDIMAPDDKDGVVVKGREIAIPRKHISKIPTEGPFSVREDVDTALAIYQVWFEPIDLGDLYAPLVKDRFTTVFTSPTDNKQYIRPASLLDADITDMLNPPLSRAAARWGKPDIYMKGSKGTQDPNKPPGVMGSGFPKNRGKAGDFVKKDTIINFSPSPSKILLPP